MFCRMVKYRAPNEGPAFYQGLEDGSMESILPLIKWLLTQQSDLTKRAFVGYHLMEVPLPPVRTFNFKTYYVIDYRSLVSGFWGGGGADSGGEGGGATRRVAA